MFNLCDLISGGAEWGGDNGGWCHRAKISGVSRRLELMRQPLEMRCYNKVYFHYSSAAW